MLELKYEEEQKLAAEEAEHAKKGIIEIVKGKVKGIFKKKPAPAETEEPAPVSAEESEADDAKEE